MESKEVWARWIIRLVREDNDTTLPSSIRELTFVRGCSEIWQDCFWFYKEIEEGGGEENEVGSVTGSSGVVAGHLLLKGPAMKSGILDWWCGPTITLVRFSASRWKSWSGRGKKTLFLQLKKKSKKKIADQFHSPSARISADFSTSMKIETGPAGVGVCLLRESRHSGELSAPPSRVSWLQVSSTWQEIQKHGHPHPFQQAPCKKVNQSATAKSGFAHRKLSKSNRRKDKTIKKINTRIDGLLNWKKSHQNVMEIMVEDQLVKFARWMTSGKSGESDQPKR